MANSKGMPRNPRIKYHFKREELDFFFQWIVGGQTHGATEAGECFFVASQIKEGDEQSWATAWTAMGERVERRAMTSLAGGHAISAREAYLRAYAYYRAPLIFMSPIHQKDAYIAGYQRAQRCFRQAAALMDPPLEVIEIPFEGHMLPGYFWPAGGEGAKAKTLLMIGGGDTFVEELYGYIGPAAHKRGYNLLIVDFPGQGMLPFEGLAWRADSETPMCAVVDYALQRPEIDPECVAAFGISGGGYLVPRAVTREKRIKACVGCSILLDLTVVWNRQFIEIYEKAGRSLPHRIGKWWLETFRKTYVTMVDTYVWRFGAGSYTGLVPSTRDCITDPTLITCPTLNIISEQEFHESGGVKQSAITCQEKIANYKQVIMPQNEGADSHAIGTNLSLMSQVVFDWLDEVLT